MPRPRASEAVTRVRVPASEPLPSVCRHNGEVPKDFDIEPRPRASLPTLAEYVGKPRAHILFTPATCPCGKRGGCMVCDGGLANCSVCGQAEGTLEEACPGPKKTRIDALPGVQYAEGTFEPGTHETPNRIVEVPSVTGPSLEALGETRLRLRANLAHARNTVKGADDTRAVAAENALRKFDESGDGIRLRLFCVNALKETSHAQA